VRRLARAGLHDFAFQTGDWRVRHRKLKRRLVGETEWLDFGGTCRAWEVMDGAGNVEEHFLVGWQGGWKTLL
jgi:hypothetical protein